MTRWYTCFRATRLRGQGLSILFVIETHGFITWAHTPSVSSLVALFLAAVCDDVHRVHSDACGLDGLPYLSCSWENENHRDIYVVSADGRCAPQLFVFFSFFRNLVIPVDGSGLRLSYRGRVAE